jgi:ABC-type molybdate transport system substrate-binding protein
MHRVFDRVMPAFEAASGRKFRIEYASTIEIAQRIIDGERTDFVVASRAGVDRLIGAQKVTADSQFDLGGSRIVVAVPKGRNAPDISNVERVKRFACGEDCQLHGSRFRRPERSLIASAASNQTPPKARPVNGSILLGVDRAAATVRSYGASNEAGTSSRFAQRPYPRNK